MPLWNMKVDMLWQHLEHLLLHTLKRQNASCQIRVLSTEYIEIAIHSSFTELQAVPKLTGKSFEAVMHEHITKCSQSSSPLFIYQ